MSLLIKCACGQVLSIFIAISIIAQHNLTTKQANYFFFLLYLTVYTVIFTITQIYIVIKKPASKYKVNQYKYVLSGVLDFLGGYLLNKSFASTTSYLIILLTQMIYPMSVATEIILFKTGKFNWKKLLSFTILASACFVVNLRQDKSEFRFSILGIFCGLLSNVFYMTNTFLQSFIVPHTGPALFLRSFALYGFVTGSLFTIFFDREHLNYEVVKVFYSEHYTIVIFYCLALASFYLAASPYIKKFGGVVFNSSVITGSVYFGLYSMFTSEFDLVGFLCYVVCIAADLVIVCLEKNEMIVNDNSVDII